MSSGDIFAIRENELFYDVRSKIILLNRLRMYNGSIPVIRGNVNGNDFT